MPVVAADRLAATPAAKLPSEYANQFSRRSSWIIGCRTIENSGSGQLLAAPSRLGVCSGPTAKVILRRHQPDYFGASLIVQSDLRSNTVSRKVNAERPVEDT